MGMTAFTACAMISPKGMGMVSGARADCEFGDRFGETFRDVLVRRRCVKKIVVSGRVEITKADECRRIQQTTNDINSRLAPSLSARLLSSIRMDTQ